MTDYIINYTDPLKGSFIIKPYTSNGPRFPTTDKRPSTSSVINSPLLLYGKGHPNYGERTNENLLHLAENFSGPSAPIVDSDGNTIPGIIWHVEVLYFYDSVGTDWYQWNGSSWTDVTSNVSGPAQPASPFNGDLWYDNTNLYRYSDDERDIQSWIQVEFEEGTSDPNASSPIHQPIRELRVNHNGTSWETIPDFSSIIDFTDATYVKITGSTMTGTLTINPSGSPATQLSLTDGSNVWSVRATSVLELSDNSTGRGISIDPSGVLNILGYGGSPSTYAIALLSATEDAIPNKAYVDALVAGSIATDSYVLSGSFSLSTLTLNTSASHPSFPSFDINGFTADQITFGAGSPLPAGSPLTINIGPVATTEVQTALNELETQKASLAGAAFTGSVTGLLPTAGSEFATKAYVDSTITTAGPYERYIITGTISTILLPGFPTFLYTTEEYRLFVFKNGVKLYANDNSSSPIIQYGYTEIYVPPGSPLGSPLLGSPINVTYPGPSSPANGIELATPPLITDVFEFILT